MTLRPRHRPPKDLWRDGRLWLVGVAFGVLCYAPALVRRSTSGWGDWQWFHHSWEVWRVALLRFGEVALWDPFHCGGVPVWGQPQSQIFAPTWWVTGLLFGTVLGHKLFIVLHVAVGYVGMVVLARRLVRLTAPAAHLAAVAFALSGFFAWRAAGGHAPFLAFHYLPWVLLCWRLAHRDPRYAVAVAGLMTLQLLEGGTYPFPLTFLLLFVDTVVTLLPPRPDPRVFRTALLAGGLTALLGSVRLLPVYLTLRAYPRDTELEDAMTFGEVLEALTAREPHAWWWGHRWVWSEYATFLGWTAVSLAAIGAGLAVLRRRHGALLVGAAAFVAIAMGNRGPWWPWPLLHQLPVFGNFHVPSRFLVLVSFHVALLAAVAVDEAARQLRRAAGTGALQRLAMGALWLLVFAVTVEVVSNHIRIAARWDGPPIVATEPDGERFFLVAEGWSAYLDRYASYPLRNVGTRTCYDPVPWDVSRRLWTGDQPQVRLEPRTAGEVTDWGRTTGTLFVEVTLAEDARVLFNQNYDPDWVLDAGEAVEDGGLLAVDLPAGTHRVEGRYAPPELPLTVALFLLGVLLAGLLVRHGRPR
jgi:hypothetical protein